MTKDLFPALFIGHGSPVNAIADNSYTRDISRAAAELPVPDGILVVSAHWHSKEPSVTGSLRPGQIYDFYGFPPELYHVVYTAPGSLKIAEMAADAYSGKMKIDPDRGIDHAAWSVLLHMYPQQNIPVLEMSIDYNSDPEFCFEQGRLLRTLRKEGILVIGSGNMVHNLSVINFNDNAEPYKWAAEFDLELKKNLERGNIDALVHYRDGGASALKSVPTPDHYLPMLYILGAMNEDEKISFIHESVQNGSVSMRSFRVG